MKIQYLQILLSQFPDIPKKPSKYFPTFEFHILKDIRSKYQFDETLFSVNGNVIFPNFHAARLFAYKINSLSDAGKRPHGAVKAGQLNAMGLIDEIYHFILRLYEEVANPNVFSRAENYLSKNLGNKDLKNILLEFTNQYSPPAVHRGEITAEDYLQSINAGKPAQESTIEEIILLFFANKNRAFLPFKELFNDEILSGRTGYLKLIGQLEAFFESEPKFGPNNQAIFKLLWAPILASPDSLEGQLRYMRENWGLILSSKYTMRISGSLDFIKEDQKIIFPGSIDTPTILPDYHRRGKNDIDGPDYERYTADINWMPNVVLLAKNIYVWLHQLSVKYNRAISKLDQIPDEELDLLSRWNFNALWLIGIWERCPASQKIKQIAGNPEAVSSAYSIYEYNIANELGGEPAFGDLRSRAWKKGIRIAADMVPNHTGIYSKWIVEHPEYFIQSSYSPFPGYKYYGPNLSDDPKVQIRIEDGYWNRTDAAVAFQLTDTYTGNIRYIYHGNDGTHMPWNDTAQLNFLKAEVREAVAQTIIHVARKFPIIRFDAAMTLAKQHFQRLWFPKPGTGGDIPSRSDHALTKHDFNSQFPQEFWREVVDRINQELPDTLLIAEAFWLLEGYFVRTLGMHRVYNTAFMNMLMREENSKYRKLIKDTLEYDPEILKRYVNFMSNPDERTAIDQFGKDGKYFGVAMMLATLPGLPMFAHGQIEGFTEKYGMEYIKAYYNETADEQLIKRHEREIFPLLRLRYLFSQVENFELYDFTDIDGNTNENVFAYSNKTDNKCAIIFFNNKYEESKGRIKKSSPKAAASGGNRGGKTVSANLCNTLKIKREDKYYYIFKDHISQLEYIRSGKELNDSGFFIELKAFQYAVFLNYLEVYDPNGIYESLASNIGSGGILYMDQHLREIELIPVHKLVTELLNEDTLASVFDSKINHDKVVEKYCNLLKTVKSFFPDMNNERELTADFQKGLFAARLYHSIAENSPLLYSTQNKIVNKTRWLIWLLTSGLGKLISQTEIGDASVRIFKDLNLDKPLKSIFANLVSDFQYPEDSVDLLIALIINRGVDSPDKLLTLIRDQKVQKYLGVNIYNEISYYSKERFEDFVYWFYSTAFLHRAVSSRIETAEMFKMIGKITKKINKLYGISAKNEFKTEKLLESINQELKDRPV